ncbi:MAG: hypothetical protein ACRDE8_12980, partial [Ginsengibacter sp.]
FKESIVMNNYRKLLLDSCNLMITTQFAYYKLAMDICLLDELKELDGYMEGEVFSRNVFETMKDPAVLRIDRFAKETDVFIDRLDEANNFLNEEFNDFDEALMPTCNAKVNRLETLAILMLYTEREVSKIIPMIDKLCVINEEPPITNYANPPYCNDENVKLIAGFYDKVLELYNDIMETEIQQTE